MPKNNMILNYSLTTFGSMAKQNDYWVSKLLRKRVTCDVLDATNLEFIESIPSFVVNRQQPNMFGERQINFNAYPKTTFPAIGVYCLENVLLNATSGWVLDTNNNVLVESTWNAGYPGEMNGSTMRQAVFPQSLSGTILSIVSDFSINNYAHKLLDCFSRYRVFLEAGFTPADVDYILVPGSKSRRWNEVCNNLGIPQEKIIWSKDYDFIYADRLLVTSYPGIKKNYPPWMVEYLKNNLVKGESNSNRRLYVQRTGRRKISNEDELIPIFKKFDFEIYLPENSTNQFNDFHEAKSVIGAHGAGLSNIVFCNSGVKLLELMPSDFIEEFYYTAADSAGLKYAYIVGESESHRPPGTRGVSLADFYIDPIVLEDAIKNFF